jgi:hypothetical protein
MHWLGERVINIIGYSLGRVADPVVFGALFLAPNDDTYVKPSKFIQRNGPPVYVDVPKPAYVLGFTIECRSPKTTGYREVSDGRHRRGCRTSGLAEGR